MTHTPTPWKTEKALYQEGHWLKPEVTPQGRSKPIAAINNGADASFILKACNVHYELVSLVTRLQHRLSVIEREFDTSPLDQEADAALAKAQQ